jgi:hypothetical protein
MGQIGNAVGGALGGQPQNPMGGGNFFQTGQFGSQPIDMGGFGNNSQLGQLGNMAAPPAQSYDQYLAGRSPMQQDVQLTQDQWQQGQNQNGFMQPGLGQPGFGQQMPQAGQMSPSMQQANAQKAFEQMQGGMGQQPAGIAGLAGLLGGMPNKPTPTAQPAPTAKPAPVAAKPIAKPSAVPAKTPPAVANAIKKLATKKPMMRR